MDKVRKKKRGVQFLQYDYEAAYNKSIEDMGRNIDFDQFRSEADHEIGTAKRK